MNLGEKKMVVINEISAKYQCNKTSNTFKQWFKYGVNMQDKRIGINHP